ncbi:MAG: aspartate aminotransferase family protein [Elusimicrobiota bacterium]
MTSKDTKNLIRTEKKYILPTYKRQGIVFVRGKGKYLWDNRGKKYLDFFSGLSVCNLGHCPDAPVAAAAEQLKKLMHVSNIYYTLPQIELAEMLIRKSYGRGRVFLSNSGAEANECAIKLARKWGNKSAGGQQAIKRGDAAGRGVRTKSGSRYEIITFEGSFHGRTLATLTATGQKKFHRGFEPMPSGFKYARFNDIESVKRQINNKTVAVFIEPIQGEGGVYPAEKKFLSELRALCDVRGLLLIFDEIQCGMGRTGKLFAYQHYGVEPDVFTLAKSIANGLPLGVTVVKEKYADVLAPGDHGSTFGGNLVSCAAAIETIKLISDDALLRNVSETGKYFAGTLIKLKNKFPEIIKEVRGAGFMLGMELLDGPTDSGSLDEEIASAAPRNDTSPGISQQPGNKIVNECALAGLIINCTQGNVLRFLPPLITDRTDVDRAIKILENILTKYNNYCIIKL